MGASKDQSQSYANAPNRDDAASTSSAVLLDDIAYLDEELPAYTDEPGPPSAPVPPTSLPSSGLDLNWYRPPPDLVFSSHDKARKEYRTLFPNYSTDATTLYDMIVEQAMYAPTYFCTLNGTHTETRRTGNNKESKDRITDFLIPLNLTRYLYAHPTTNKLQMLPSNKRGYRGTRFPSLNPTINIETEDGEDTKAELQSWCERYVTDKSAIKCFTLKRKVINHDTAKLTQLLHSCIQETGYRGHLQVTYPLQHETVVVYSPGLINTWRTTTWIRWMFYLSMLWIISWPILKLCTVRYDVVEAVFPYANKKPGDSMADGIERIPSVMSEVDWYRRWESAIRRAALSRMNCSEISLSEDYRTESEQVERRAQMEGRNGVERGPPPSTGNAFADGALGFLGHGLRLVGEYNGNANAARGWGADTN